MMPVLSGEESAGLLSEDEQQRRCQHQFDQFVTVELPWATTSDKWSGWSLPTGSSISQIAIGESSHKQPPPISNHLP